MRKLEHVPYSWGCCKQDVQHKLFHKRSLQRVEGGAYTKQTAVCSSYGNLLESTLVFRCRYLYLLILCIERYDWVQSLRHASTRMWLLTISWACQILSTAAEPANGLHQNRFAAGLTKNSSAAAGEDSSSFGWLRTASDAVCRVDRPVHRRCGTA